MDNEDVEQPEDEAPTPNAPTSEEEEINIGTILCYLVSDCVPPVNHTNVVLGPDVITELGERINLGNNYSCPSTSGGHQSISIPELTLLGVLSATAQVTSQVCQLLQFPSATSGAAGMSSWTSIASTICSLLKSH